MCPYDALTSKLSHKYFLIVADLAGDSTITRFFGVDAIVMNVNKFLNACTYMIFYCKQLCKFLKYLIYD